PMDVTVTLNDLETDYNGKAVSVAAAACIENKSSDLFGVDDLEIVFDEVVKNAGKYAIKVKFKKESVGANFYLTATNAATLTVRKAELTVTLGALQLTYNGKTQAIKLNENAVTVGTNFDSLTYKNFRAVCGEEIKNAAEYAYDVEFISETHLNNYELITDTTNAKVTVTGVNITVTTKALTSEYNGKAAVVDAADAIVNITGANADLAKSKINGFTVKFAETPVTAGTYTYTIQTADPACKDNFIIDYAGERTLTITKRKVDLVLKDFMMTESEVDNAGGLTSMFEVSKYIEVSQFTPLLDGVKLVVREAGAFGDGNGNVILFGIDVLITDIEGKTVLGWLRIMDDGSASDLTGFVQSECYEFNLSAATIENLTAKITVIK
ncbi:MAG: hypothetical protein K2O67_02200, partial [Clostridia bacterium]|nr:hypothetical protein [Clostridia bacterium]